MAYPLFKKGATSYKFPGIVANVFDTVNFDSVVIYDSALLK